MNGTTKRKLPPAMRKTLFALHILFSAIMLGEIVAYVIMGVAALTTDNSEVLNACYTIMHLLAKTSLRASTIGATITGIMLSLLTPWGLFRYYWIIVKEVLTLFTIGVGLVGIYVWTLRGLNFVSAEGIRSLSEPAYAVNSARLGIGVLLELFSIVAMFLLSVFKPWGERNHGRRLLNSKKR